ncbi:hypothetical protein AAFF_G00000600 [Aldrovandia affinis]|uniref:Uncharacterized protein n=1 Tax=Aldrovandia affinis TaxID=143900 RepID=A0AAD7TCU6_9TELE|nr:hypothetical protein AAFF_G00000600 [Aldrovandia affinis]
MFVEVRQRARSFHNPRQCQLGGPTVAFMPGLAQRPTPTPGMTHSQAAPRHFLPSPAAIKLPSGSQTHRLWPSLTVPTQHSSSSLFGSSGLGPALLLEAQCALTPSLTQGAPPPAHRLSERAAGGKSATKTI